MTLRPPADKMLLDGDLQNGASHQSTHNGMWWACGPSAANESAPPRGNRSRKISPLWFVEGASEL
jgi:hypothetical protein